MVVVGRGRGKKRRMKQKGRTCVWVGIGGKVGGSQEVAVEFEEGGRWEKRMGQVGNTATSTEGWGSRGSVCVRQGCV